MELLDFYAKILPDQLFTRARDQRSQPKYWVGDAYGTVTGSSVLRDIDNTTTSEPCGETGCYTSMYGMNIPLQRQSKQPDFGRFLLDDPTLRFQPKKEVRNMFDPRQGVLQNNVAVETDQIKERMTTTSRKNDGTDPGLRIGPGLGRNATDNTQRGIHPTFRILPRNIDSLRTPLNAKTVYTNPTPVLGKVASKGISSQHVGRIEKRTADTFSVKPLTIRSQAQVPKATQYGKPIDLPTQRQVRSDPVAGHAHATHIKKGQTELDYFFEDPMKNTYREPNPMHVGVGGGTAINNPKNVVLHDTQRQIATAPHVTGPQRSGIGTAINYDDLPRDTIRQQTTVSDKQGHVVTGPAKSTRYSVTAPDLTQRNTTAPTQSPGPISSSKAGEFVYNKENWTPRDTIRQQTGGIIHSSGGMQNTEGGRGRAVDFADTTKETHRQSTGSIIILPSVATSTRAKYSQATESLPRNQGARQIVHEDVGIGNAVMTRVGRVVNNPKDVPTVPHRETMGSAPVTAGRFTAGGSGKIISRDFNPRDSLRETTQHNPDAMRAGQTNQGYVTIDANDVPKETGRQTLGATDVTNVSRTSRGHRLEESDDLPETHRQTTTEKNVVQHPARAREDGYRTDATEFRETQRQLSSESNVVVGAKYAHSLPTLFEDASHRLNECRNESWGRVEKRSPTVIGQAILPNKNVSTGSIYLKPDTDQQYVRAAMPTPPVYVFETPDFSNTSSR